MASVGIRRRVSRRTGLVTYQVWWLLDDGSQGAETVASKDQARALAAQKRLQITRDTWQGRRRGRLPFSTWADLWWADWSADPHRSPHTLVMAESRLRNHVRPFFGDRAIDKIGPAEIRRWQTQLAATTGHATVQQCRSLLLRIFHPSGSPGWPTRLGSDSTPPPSTPAALALMSRFLLVGWRAAGFVHKPARRIFSGRYLGWD
jgi:Phage integrase, N-terminal SAM-like domain